MLQIKDLDAYHICFHFHCLYENSAIVNFFYCRKKWKGLASLSNLYLFNFKIHSFLLANIMKSTSVLDQAVKPDFVLEGTNTDLLQIIRIWVLFVFF